MTVSYFINGNYNITFKAKLYNLEKKITFNLKLESNDNMQGPIGTLVEQSSHKAQIFVNQLVSILSQTAESRIRTRCKLQNLMHTSVIFAEHERFQLT